MNELQAIVEAYEEARTLCERAALVTVISVEGSAYRRAGARLLLTESGRTVGAISGGCLERDVCLRAAEVLDSGAARIIEYDTRGSEDIVWGLGAGCNGVVRVLIESLHQGSSGERALQFIASCLNERKTGVLATVTCAAKEKHESDAVCHVLEVGERLLLDDELNICEQGFFEVALIERIRDDAHEVLMSERAATRTYETSAGRTEIFFDLIKPPRTLVIFGAEHDALPLMRLARTLGWHATVVDTRARVASLERFAEADAVQLCRAEEVPARIALTPQTAAVVMTHNYLDDVELLRALLPSPVCYLGILGPKQRTSLLLEEIRADVFGLAGSQFARLHSPIGLDIGAETPQEIALAIMAEIKAVCASRRAGFLRERNAPIHVESLSEIAAMEISIEPRLSERESAQVAACHSS